MDTTKRDMEDFFEKYHVHDIDIAGKWAFVTMETLEDAEGAVKNLDGKWMRDRQVTVTFKVPLRCELLALSQSLSSMPIPPPIPIPMPLHRPSPTLILRPATKKGLAAAVVAAVVVVVVVAGEVDAGAIAGAPQKDDHPLSCLLGSHQAWGSGGGYPLSSGGGYPHSRSPGVASRACPASGTGIGAGPPTVVGLTHGPHPHEVVEVEVVVIVIVGPRRLGAQIPEEGGPHLAGHGPLPHIAGHGPLPHIAGNGPLPHTAEG